MTDFLSATTEYYARWLDLPAAAVGAPGVRLTITEKRGAVPKGHGRAVPLYALRRGEGLSVAVSPAFARATGFSAFPAGTKTAADGVLYLEKRFADRLGHGRAHVFSRLPADLSPARAARLCPADYPAFLEFFRTIHPKAQTDGWLEEYFTDIAARGRAFGVWEDGRLACVADAPDLAHMEEAAAEPGINTLPALRRRGYAAAACAAFLEAALAEGLAPLWTCRADNASSLGLAARLGYLPFGELYTVEAPPENP